MKTLVSRREILKGGVAVGAGLTLGFALPLRGRAQTPGVFAPNQWLRIDRDGIVTITNSVPEMGQGSLTTTTMIIADELDAKLDNMKVEQAPANPALYKNPVTGNQSYGGSRGVRDHIDMWRKAAASAREMLKQAAANEWGVPVESVETEEGAVVHRPTGRRLQYGQLVDKAQALPVPQNPKLKTADKFRYIGKPVKRLDTPDKVTGRGIYGIDVQVPGMLVGSVERCPVFGGKVQSFDATAARLTGLPPEKVIVNTTLLGGGFGRRGEIDFIVDAVETSKAVGAPVKVVWTREDDITHGFYRPATYNVFRAALDANGMPSAWFTRIVGPGILIQKGRAQAGTIDPAAVEAVRNMPYDIPNLRIEWNNKDLGIPLGFWRSVGPSQNGFIIESFIDELAHAAGKDPFEYRRALLGKSPRHKAILELVANRANWGSPPPAGRGRGIAVVFSYGSYAATAAEVSVARDGAIKVHRLVCGIDAGLAVNPDAVKAQMEGGAVYALTAAYYGQITIDRGRVQQSNFHDYPMLRINEMPVVDVHILDSGEAPGGLGEPGVPSVAPAVTNAIFALTGKRIRKLPIDRNELKRA
jgi:CO/xanthine dehydrogenase Mo-binding subunit